MLTKFAQSFSLAQAVLLVAVVFGVLGYVVVVTTEQGNFEKLAKVPKPVCEYARPPEGCHWEGMKKYPNCSAAYLVCGDPISN